MQDDSFALLCATLFIVPSGKRIPAAMKTIRKRIIRYLLRIFSLPRVKEEIARYANAFMGEASRYSTGIKGEAVETKESFLILTKYIRKEKLSREEKRTFKLQVLDILKGVGVIVPPMLIPLPFVGTLLLIIMDHLLLSMNIRILPSSFYPEVKKELLTPEAIEDELTAELNRNEQ
jgi:hypothetical protein